MPALYRFLARRHLALASFPVNYNTWLMQTRDAHVKTAKHSPATSSCLKRNALQQILASQVTVPYNSEQHLNNVHYTDT